MYYLTSRSVTACALLILHNSALLLVTPALSFFLAYHIDSMTSSTTLLTDVTLVSVSYPEFWLFWRFGRGRGGVSRHLGFELRFS
jgi:hypothetical protein